MSKYTNVQLGKVYTLTLGPGEDILKCVNALIEKEHLQNAVFLSGGGSISECHTHFAIKQSDGSFMDIPRSFIDTPFKICGVSGFIEEKPDGSHMTHLHGVIGNDRESWTVHLHDRCLVLHNFTLVIAELL